MRWDNCGLFYLDAPETITHNSPFIIAIRVLISAGTMLCDTGKCGFLQLVGLLASIYRYEKIESVFRGTIDTRHSNFFESLAFLPSLATNVTSAVVLETTISTISLLIFTVETGINENWFIVAELVLGIRMTSLVRESAR